jgi:hypothetical protein
MAFDADLREFGCEIRRTQAPSPELMTRFVERTRTRSAISGHVAKIARIQQLIELQAWTETAMALVELELPQWKLRRLICEEGLWLCSLTRQSNFPEWLADQVESRHEALPLAILGALIAARQCGEPAPPRRAGSVPQCRARVGAAEAPGEIACCDNFA